MSDRKPPSPFLLCGIVVHWNAEDLLHELLRAWPLKDPRFELVVIDNGSRYPLLVPPPARLIRTDRNLGFAGGINRGLAETQAPLVLLLNPDARPEAQALDELLRGFETHPTAAGLAPRLVSPRGEPQFRWQLRPLPAPLQLLAQTLLLPGIRGPLVEPECGTVIEQPAAAALALRRGPLLSIGGLDDTFHPAWFEDVDLGRRLRQAGERILYWPRACFRHHLASSLPSLGYGHFLWIYYRNLVRYLTKHHGRGWAWAARWSLVLGLLMRLAALPLRCPQRAPSRRAAAHGLLQATGGALRSWRYPLRIRRPPEPTESG